MNDKQKRYFIQILLKKTRYIAQIRDILDHKIHFILKAYPNFPEEKYEEVQEIYDAIILERIINLFSEIFTLDEIKEIITFYSTPAGQKISDKAFFNNINKELESVFDSAEEEISKF